MNQEVGFKIGAVLHLRNKQYRVYHVSYHFGIFPPIRLYSLENVNDASDQIKLQEKDLLKELRENLIKDK